METSQNYCTCTQTHLIPLAHHHLQGLTPSERNIFRSQRAQIKKTKKVLTGQRAMTLMVIAVHCTASQEAEPWAYIARIQ
jgi:hypothetical protein